MSIVFKTDLDIVFILLLLYVFGVAYRRLDRRDICNQSFLWICLLTIVQMVIDVAWIPIDKINVPWLIPLSAALNTVSFSLSPMMTYFWLVFVYYWIFKKPICSLHKILLYIPICANAMLAVLSPFFGFVFYVDSSNVYRRGPFFLAYFFITFFYLFVSCVLMLKNMKKMNNSDFLPMMMFFIVPTAGGVIQGFHYGLFLLWSCVGFSLVLIYIFLQHKMMQIDSMTGAWTKATFEEYIERKAEHLSDGQNIGIIFLDMDHFKAINDTLGHIEGDQALYTTVSLIKKCLPENGIIARFGGDEFVILLENTTQEALNELNEVILALFDQHNQTSGKPYSLSFSSGCGIFGGRSEGIWECLNRLDYEMYQNKNC